MTTPRWRTIHGILRLVTWFRYVSCIHAKVFVLVKSQKLISIELVHFNVKHFTGLQISASPKAADLQSKGKQGQKNRGFHLRKTHVFTRISHWCVLNYAWKTPWHLHFYSSQSCIACSRRIGGECSKSRKDKNNDMSTMTFLQSRSPVIRPNFCRIKCRIGLDRTK